MSDDDKELEVLKAKRLAEMQKNLSVQEKQKESEHKSSMTKKNQPTLREYVVKNLGYRGMEVLENAETQFPNEAKIIVEKIGELIASGDINEVLDGGKLLVLFRSVGINIRMQNKINVEQDLSLIHI